MELLAKQTAEAIQLMVATGIPRSMAHTTLTNLVASAFKSGVALSKESDRDFVTMLQRALTPQLIVSLFKDTDDLLLAAVGPDAIQAYNVWMREQGGDKTTQAWEKLWLKIGERLKPTLEPLLAADEKLPESPPG